MTPAKSKLISFSARQIIASGVFLFPMAFCCLPAAAQHDDGQTTHPDRRFALWAEKNAERLPPFVALYGDQSRLSRTDTASSLPYDLVTSSLIHCAYDGRTLSVSHILETAYRQDADGTTKPLTHERPIGRSGYWVSRGGNVAVVARSASPDGQWEPPMLIQPTGLRQDLPLWAQSVLPPGLLANLVGREDPGPLPTSEVEVSVHAIKHDSARGKIAYNWTFSGPTTAFSRGQRTFSPAYLAKKWETRISMITGVEIPHIHQLRWTERSLADAAQTQRAGGYDADYEALGMADVIRAVKYYQGSRESDLRPDMDIRLLSVEDGSTSVAKGVSIIVPPPLGLERYIDRREPQKSGEVVELMGWPSDAILLP